MEWGFYWCTPCASVFEGVMKSSDGRDTPNKLSWQAHTYVEKFRQRVDGEVLSAGFSGWLMGFPSGWFSSDPVYGFSLTKG